MSEKRVARSHPRTSGATEWWNEEREFLEFLLMLAIGILAIGFIEAL